MFGWFESKPRCPVEPHLQRWIEYRMAWLVDQFGMDRLLATRVILPTAEFFPEPYSPTPQGARDLLDQVCSYMGVSPESVELGFYSQQDPDSAGLYQRTADSAKIWLEVSDVDDPGPVIAVMAHEAAHHLLLRDQRLTGDEEDHEPLTDLLTIFLGFGVFTSEALLQESNYTSGNWHYSKWQRRGYLSFPVCGYALAVFARNRQEARPGWASYLRADVRTVFQSGLRFLVETGTSGLTGDGPCAFYSADGSSSERQVADARETGPPERERETGEAIEDPAEADHEAVDFDQGEDSLAESDSDSHFTRGVFLAGQGNHEEAIAAFTEAIQVDPNDAELYSLRADSYRQLARSHEALADAERAVQLDPDDLASYNVRAKCYFVLSRFVEAIKDCDLILRTAQQADSCYHLRGLAHAARSEYDRAVKDFGQAIRHNPQTVVYYKDRANAFEKLGRYEEASRDRMEIARRDPFSTLT